MKVVFLAGGIGKRMLPVTKEKSLLKFLGKELILHQIEWAEKAGFKEFVIIGNPLNISTFKELIGDKAEYAVQLDPKGMADALLSAKELLKGTELLIANPNDTIEVSAYEAVLKQEGQVVMLAQEVSEYFPGGYLDVDENDRVKRIVEKPGKGNEPSNLVNIVLHLHRNSDELFGYLESTTSAKDDVYETAIQRMINNQIDVRVARYNGYWSAIKYPHHILNIMDYFTSKLERKISPNAEISDKATIKGNVVIEDGVKVLEGAVINGPVYIGKNCLVGNNALVRAGTMLGDRSVVGYSTELKHSYVGEDCFFHNNYIGDSVIMDDCLFGSGAVTANFRFDEKPVYTFVKGEQVDTGMFKLGCVIGERTKLGINTSIYPGIKVGHNCHVGPGVVLKRDVGDNEVILLEQQFEVRKNTFETQAKEKSDLIKKQMK